MSLKQSILYGWAGILIVAFLAFCAGDGSNIGKANDGGGNGGYLKNDTGGSYAPGDGGMISSDFGKKDSVTNSGKDSGVSGDSCAQLKDCCGRISNSTLAQYCNSTADQNDATTCQNSYPMFSMMCNGVGSGSGIGTAFGSGTGSGTPGAQCQALNDCCNKISDSSQKQLCSSLASYANNNESICGQLLTSMSSSCP